MTSFIQIIRDCRPRWGKAKPRFWLGSVSFGWATAILGPGTPAAQAALCPAELVTQIDATLAAAPLHRSYIGVLLQTQQVREDERQILYARHAHQFFTPASNAKVLTTAAALHSLGAGYRIRTSIYSSPGPGESTNLQLVGRGDPTLTESDLIRLGQSIAQRGIRQVNQLVLQDTYFPGFATNPTWEWGDAQADYAVPVNSLIVNQNAVTVQVAPTRVGQPLSILWPEDFPTQAWLLQNDTSTVAAQENALPVSLWRSGGDNRVYATGQLPQQAAPLSFDLAVLNPAYQFATVFNRVLKRQGITVAQTTITHQAQTLPGAALATLESPPLAELLIPANQDSNNLYAEVLFKTLGVTYGGTPGANASAAGGAAVAAVLAELGLDSTTIRLADGSGLSRHNLVTPAALVNTLQAMAIHPEAEVFRDSLAVAGVSGTLRNRLRNTPLEGNVQGKSGALTGNVSLSGYLQPPNYEPLVFSILINHSDQHARILRDRIDQLLLLIAQLSSDC